MSFRAVLWAFDQYLPPVTKLILTVLASHASKRDGSCFPAVRTIAREASVSPRTVHRHLPVLEQKRLIRIERKFEGKARLPHKYWLACPSEVSGERAGHPNAVPGRRGYDSQDHSKNHYPNHNMAQRGERRVGARAGAVGARRGPTPAQAVEQAAQRELASRLGEGGWEILTAFAEEVPKLCAQLRKGTLTQAQLVDLRTRYILDGGAA